MVTLTRLVAPRTVLMLFALAVAETAPPQLVAKVTWMLAGVMVPLGKPEPTTFTLSTPATPLSGVVQVVRFTVGTEAEALCTAARQHASNASGRTFCFRTRTRRTLGRVIATPRRQVASSVHAPGSGTLAAVPVVAVIRPKSPSTRLGESENVTLNDELIVTGPTPLTLILVVLNVPVSVASFGLGFVPPIGMMPPLKDSPSEPSVIGRTEGLAGAILEIDLET